MSNDLKNLEPRSMWSHFADLNAVPRPSKKEERVIKFIKDFGASLQLETIEDEVGNVIIKKPATPGMENRQTVVMQSHLDMVHQKNNETVFDFDTQGIDMYVDGDWVKARGTTLGADNGIGVASIMALLASKDIEHPALEALFTIDEETGMTGAMGLKGGLLDGSIMLNLDTEDDNELTIGCAGGVDVTATGNYGVEGVPEGKTAFKITLKGLSGGHSGMDIHRGLGNANKLLTRILMQASSAINVHLVSFDGGGLRNAIPREASAVVLVDAAHVQKFNDVIVKLSHDIKAEHTTTDPNLMLATVAVDLPAQMPEVAFQQKLLRCLRACPNGIYRMSPDISSLVQTSNNLARVLVKDGSYSIQCLTRSSVDSEKTDLAEAICATFQLMGANVDFSGSYPGWTPKPGSDIVKLMSNLYFDIFKEKAHVNACHAGLECGILGANYPEMEMISFGPNIRGAHSPDEKVQISSVQKYWGLLLETLKKIPEKA
jgi:dipeptidase D